MVRIGNSIDIHAFCKDKPLILGGVLIDYEFGLLGHSDADVVMHSVCEAIIGAMGLGDIGTHFPDTDEKYRGIDSSLLLSQVVELMEQYNFTFGNADVTILCEKPHLSKYKLQMKENIAKIIKTDSNNINIKATRGEKLGFIGRSEGIASMCSVILEKE